MSQENVEVVRGAIRAFERGDINAVLSACHPEIKITQLAELPGVPRHLSGHSGVLESFSLWTEQWDDFRLEVLDFTDVNDHVAVTMFNRGRGHESGVQVEAKFIHVFTVRDGMITEWRIFMSADEAREALGLEE